MVAANFADNGPNATGARITSNWAPSFVHIERHATVALIVEKAVAVCQFAWIESCAYFLTCMARQRFGRILRIVVKNYKKAPQLMS